MNNSQNIYIGILQDEIKKINVKIKELSSRKKTLRNLMGTVDVKIEKLEIEKKSLEEKINNLIRPRENAVAETIISEASNLKELKNEDIEKISKEVTELNQLKGQLTSARKKKRIQKKIEYKQDKIRKIKRSQTRLDKFQRTLMLPKRKVTKFKESLLYKREAKVNYFEESYKDAALLKEAAANKHSISSLVMGKVYDIQMKYYKRRNEHAKEVLNQVREKNSVINLVSANAIVYSKKAASILSNKMSSEIGDMEKDFSQKQQSKTL